MPSTKSQPLEPWPQADSFASGDAEPDLDATITDLVPEVSNASGQHDSFLPT